MKHDKQQGTFELKVGLAEMLKGGVIMDVTTPEQAKIAEDAGAVAVMARERIPADIRLEGGVSRMSDPGHHEGRHPGDPAKRARAIVMACTHYNDPARRAEISEGLGEPMVGFNLVDPAVTRFATREV